MKTFVLNQLPPIQEFATSNPSLLNHRSLDPESAYVVKCLIALIKPLSYSMTGKRLLMLVKLLKIFAIVKQIENFYFPLAASWDITVQFLH